MNIENSLSKLMLYTLNCLKDLQALTILEKVEKSIRCMHLPASSRLQEYGKMVRAGNLATHGHQV